MPVMKNPIPNLTPREIVRFDLNIIKTGYTAAHVYHEWNSTPCWIWTGTPSSVGRAVFNLKRNGRNYGFIAARIMYKRHYGVDPGDRQVCHHCDYKMCISPYHFFDGDPSGKDNMEDMSNKRRTRSRYPIHELSDSDIETIRAEVADGRSASSIAKERNMPTSSIGRIASGRFYPAAPGPLTPFDPDWQKNKVQRKLFPNDIHEIWRSFLDEESSKASLSKRFDVSDVAIGLVLHGTKHKASSSEYLATRNLTLAQGVELVRRRRRSY